MQNTQPLSDPKTHYLIEVQGRVDADWLKRFDSSVEISVDQTVYVDSVTRLDVHTDQSGVVGLVRSLHRLGIAILELKILPENID